MQRFLLWATVCAGLAFAGAVRAAARLDPMLNDLPVDKKVEFMQQFSPVMSRLGSGYNSVTNTMLGVGGCVNGTFIPPPKSEGSSLTYQLDVITSYEELTQATSVEAEVSGSFGGFSASVKSEFNSSDTSKATRTHLLVREYVNTQEINLDHRSMTIAAALNIKGKDKTAASLGPFLQACGDEFVSTFQMGGEFIALLSADETSDNLKSNLNISTSASYGGASASGDFNKSMEKLRNTSSLSVTMTRIGGGGELPQIGTAAGSATVDAILTYASKFPTTVENDPVIYRPIAIPYREGINFDVGDYSAAKTAYGKMSSNRDRLGAAVIDLNRVLKAYDEFDIQSASPRQAARSRLDSAQADLALINPLMERCGRALWLEHACDAPPRFLDDNFAAPKAPALFVQNLNPRAGLPIQVDIPAPMTVVMRGRYCYDANNDQSCLVNEAWDPSKSGDAFVSLYGNGVHVDRYLGGPLRFKPGKAFVWLHDTDASDNWGDPKLVAFEEP